MSILFLSTNKPFYSSQRQTNKLLSISSSGDTHFRSAEYDQVSANLVFMGCSSRWLGYIIGHRVLHYKALILLYHPSNYE